MVCLWKGGIDDICPVKWRSVIGCNSWCKTYDDDDDNDDDGGGCGDDDHDGDDDDHHYYHGIDVGDHGDSDYDNHSYLLYYRWNRTISPLIVRTCIIILSWRWRNHLRYKSC